MAKSRYDEIDIDIDIEIEIEVEIDCHLTDKNKLTVLDLNMSENLKRKIICYRIVI